MNKFIILIFTLTITNAIFIFMLHADLKKHEAVIDRQGIILTTLLQSPDVQAILNKVLTNTK